MIKDEVSVTSNKVFQDDMEAIKIGSKRRVDVHGNPQGMKNSPEALKRMKVKDE